MVDSPRKYSHFWTKEIAKLKLTRLKNTYLFEHPIQTDVFYSFVVELQLEHTLMQLLTKAVLRKMKYAYVSEDIDQL